MIIRYINCSNGKKNKMIFNTLLIVYKYIFSQRVKLSF